MVARILSIGRQRMGRGVRRYAEVCRDVDAQGGRVCLDDGRLGTPSCAAVI